MNEEQEISKIINQPRIFTRRLDFYWKSIPFYTIALIVYSILRGSIVGYTLTLVLYDPIVLLLILFIIGSTIAHFVNTLKNKTVSIDKDSITFHSRLNEKTYTHEDIKKISLAHKKFIQFQNNITVIKIFITKRKRPIRIRPTSYWNEKELLQSILTLKKRLNR